MPHEMTVNLKNIILYNMCTAVRTAFVCGHTQMTKQP